MSETRILPDGGHSNDYMDNWLKEMEPVNLPLEPFISNQEKWDRRFLELAKHISEWSKDPSTCVGAVIVDANRMVVGMGYNGFPRGVEDTDERLNDRPTKYSLIVHAEQNAILNAGHRTEGSTIYVYPSFGKPPLCSNCAKSVIQAGIRRVVGYSVEQDDVVRASRWKEELDAAYLMCSEAGLEMDMIDP